MKNGGYLGELNTNGFVIIPSILNSTVVSELRKELEAAMQQDLNDKPNVFDKGMVHNCMTRGNNLKEILDNPVLDKYVGKVLSETYILYAYQSSSLIPNDKNYGSRIHVDSPRYIPGYQTNIGVIFPLDDFTEENGATHLLPGSHLSDMIPAEDDFIKNEVRAICKAGDMIIFLGRSWHRAGVNHTNKTRHSITLNFCRSYMRQRFDYPRLLSQSFINSLRSQGKRLIGMNVRVPVSLEEFYLPEDKRLYKANQG